MLPSKAPMSQRAPTGRGTPRWSVAGQSTLFAASMAGLSSSNAIVFVGPPLSAREASRGSVWFRLPGVVKLQVPSELILSPPSMILSPL